MNRLQRFLRPSGSRLIGVLLVLLMAPLAQSETIYFYAAAGVKVPAEALMAAFEQQTGHQVTRVYDTAGAAEQRFIDNGRQGVLVSTQSRIAKAASLQDGVTQTVGDTLAAVAFAPHVQRMAIDTPAGLKAALLGARRIAFSDPARGATVGLHFMTVIEQLQIRDEVLAKAEKARDGIATMKLVLAGDVDLGITQLSEVMQADPKRLLGPFPAELELATRYSSWYARGNSPAVQSLAEALASPQGRALLERHGLRVP